jgi:hypothetical protein
MGSDDVNGSGRSLGPGCGPGSYCLHAISSVVVVR